MEQRNYSNNLYCQRKYNNAFKYFSVFRNINSIHPAIFDTF